VGVGDHQVPPHREAAAEQQPAAAAAADLHGGPLRPPDPGAGRHLRRRPGDDRRAQVGEGVRERRAGQQPAQLGQRGRRAGGVAVDGLQHARPVHRPGERRERHVAEGQGDEPQRDGGHHGGDDRAADGVDAARPAAGEHRADLHADQVPDRVAGGGDQEEHHHREQQPADRAAVLDQEAEPGGGPRPQRQAEQQPGVAQQHHREAAPPAAQGGQGEDDEQEEVDGL
jgi:hypothetical protein